jgi:membrane dipeptidase
MHTRHRFILIVAIFAVPCLMLAQSTVEPQVSARAKQIHERAIVVDSHGDTPQRLLFDKAFNIAVRNKDGNIDIPRMREGGLDAMFFSIWVPSELTGPPAVKRALDLIDSVREVVRTHPNELVLATNAADVRRAAAEHLKRMNCVVYPPLSAK